MSTNFSKTYMNPLVLKLLYVRCFFETLLQMCLKMNLLFSKNVIFQGYYSEDCIHACTDVTFLEI
jgi:hypothetical protein